MYRTIIILFGSVLFACSGGGSKQGVNEQEEPNTTSPDSGSCMEKFVGKTGEILTIEEVKQLANTGDKAVESEESTAGGTDYQYTRFQWEDGRTLTIKVNAGNRDIEVTNPLDDFINVGWVEKLEEKQMIGDETSFVQVFDRMYGPKTKAQKEETKKAIEKASKESDKVDEKSAAVISAMVDAENVKSVEGIGDRAVLTMNDAGGMRYPTLRVLVGNTVFQVRADVSDNDPEDIEMVKKVGAYIVSNCE